MKFSSSLKGNRKSSYVCWGGQKIFMNLNPIPGVPPGGKK